MIFRVKQSDSELELELRNSGIAGLGSDWLDSFSASSAHLHLW